MPPNTLRVHTENVLFKSVGLKFLWAGLRVQGTGEYFPPIQFHGKIVEGEISGGAIYRPFGEFLRTKSYCHLTAAVAFQARPRRALLMKDLVTWQAMEVRHILEGIAGRVAKFVDEHCLADKGHLGDMIAQAVQLMLKSTSRN
ncbi:uncharacterized protein TNCV_713101 [Trichonephila clavipes]|nr:uncharacterized protein TNCV_713101 [Trichonephila clavipes]